MEATKEVGFDEGGCWLRKEKKRLPAEPLVIFSNHHELWFFSLFDTFVLSFYLLDPTMPSPPRCLFGDVPFPFSLQLNYMVKPVVSSDG